MFWLVRQFLFLRRAVWAKDSPRQLALGLAFGVMLGLAPKGNLLAIGLAAMIFGTRVSLATGMLSALVVSFVAPLADPLTHGIGQFVLTRPLLLPIWQSLYRLPLFAWTSFNNTVVMGSFLLGAGLCYPVYRVSLPWFARRRARMLETVRAAEPATEFLAHGPQKEPQQETESLHRSNGLPQSARRRCA